MFLFHHHQIPFLRETASMQLSPESLAQLDTKYGGQFRVLCCCRAIFLREKQRQAD